MVKSMNRVWIATIALIGVVAGFALVMHLATALAWHQSALHWRAAHTRTCTVDGATRHWATSPGRGWITACNRKIRSSPLMTPPCTTHGSNPDYGTARARYDADAGRALRVGDTISFTISTGLLARAECPIGDIGLIVKTTYQVGTFPDTDWIGFFVIPFVTGVITFLIGAVVLALRPNQPDRPAHQSVRILPVHRS